MLVKKYWWHLFFKSLRLELLRTVFDPKDSGWEEAWISGIQPQNGTNRKMMAKRASDPNFFCQYLLATSSSTGILFCVYAFG